MGERNLKLLNQGVYADIVLQLPATDVGLEHCRGVQEEHLNGLRVIKVVQAPRNGVDSSRLPHNIVLEVQILQQVNHLNIVPYLGYEYHPERSLHELYLPLLAFPLEDLLEGPLSNPDLRIAFRHLAQQAFSGLSHLHGLGISHRDINPRNLMIDWNATLVFIDFSTAFAPNILSTGEQAGQMVCQVGTGSYRAPELLFGCQAYDPQAIDLWAIGTVLAEFFLSSRHVVEMDENPLDDSFDQSRPGEKRLTLFDATFGDIGLAASIFRVRGSPRYSWPEFDALPDSDKVSFDDVPPRTLRRILPRLQHVPQADRMGSVLEGLLALSPSKRISAKAALQSLDSLAEASGDVEEDKNWKGSAVKDIFDPYFLVARKRIMSSITTRST